ncbi:hypothetical protein [Desulforamulus aeronauticus]|uniref:hypothetical protein n=1 Tax=Desulforamulus aeronauticus TaxID=53343 RepID=UPI0011149D45|nr:hypothetical protein [Desulforamulus aeronauticus]
MINHNWEYVIEMAKSFKMLLGPESALGVTDHEKYLYYQPGTLLNQGITTNDSIKAGSLADKVLKSRSRITAKIGPELFGVAFLGIGVPLYDTGGEIIGSLLLGQPTAIQDALLGDARKLEESFRCHCSNYQWLNSCF